MKVNVYIGKKNITKSIRTKIIEHNRKHNPQMAASAIAKFIEDKGVSVGIAAIPDKGKMVHLSSASGLFANKEDALKLMDKFQHENPDFSGEIYYLDWVAAMFPALGGTLKDAELLFSTHIQA